MSKKITRGQFLGALGVAALGATASPLLAACGGDDDVENTGGPVSPSKVSDIPVKVGYLPITDSTPLTLGYAGGYFADEGLNAEKPALFRGWSQLAEAFMADQVNVAHFLMPMTVWMRYGIGFPVKVVAWDHINGSALTVHQEGGIDSIKDLGGKQIAVPFWYSIHNVVLQMALRHHNLEAVIQDRNRELAGNQVNLFRNGAAGHADRTGQSFHRRLHRRRAVQCRRRTAGGWEDSSIHRRHLEGSRLLRRGAERKVHQ